MIKEGTRIYESPNAVGFLGMLGWKSMGKKRLFTEIPKGIGKFIFYL